MKVKDLVLALQNCDQELDVFTMRTSDMEDSYEVIAINQINYTTNTNRTPAVFIAIDD